MKQATVLIISDDAGFSRAVTGRWQSERNLPAFTVLRPELCQDLAQPFEAAIVGGVRSQDLPRLIDSLHVSGKPVLLVSDDPAPVSPSHPRVAVVQLHDGWLETVVLVMNEILRRSEAVGRLRRIEQDSVVLQREATLGRYVLEMRHNLNNALTAVLGNAELLLLEPGSLSAGSRSQLETVRNMALRIHEIMQRFSSLEKELSVVEQQAKKDNHIRVHAAGQ